MVLIYHGTSEVKSIPAGLSGFLKNGSLGVSLFFILSGFVLTYTYQGTVFSGRDFFAARFARIYPVYIFSLLVAAPLFFKSFIAEGNGDRVVPLVLGKIFLIQSWVPWMMHNWNVPSWSLSTEAFFYLLFPLLLPALSLVPAKLRLPGIVALITVYGFGLPISEAIGPDYSLSPVRDVFLFGSGILIGLAFCEGWRAPRWLLPLSLVGALGLMGAFDPIPANGWLKAEFTLVLCALIGGIASIPAQSSSFMNNGTLKRLGEASYALYILHLPIAAVFAFAGSKLGFSFDNPLILVVYVPVSIWISVIVYLKLEVPANRWLRKRLSGARP